MKDIVYQLIEDYRKCRDCILGYQRSGRGKDIVFGAGPIPAKGMIVGESPGKNEEKDTIPFHPNANAGSVLHKVMQSVGLDIKNWFVTNAMICAPLTDKLWVLPSEEKASIFGDGESDGAISACRPRLYKTIELVEPSIIVALGRDAHISLTKKPVNRVGDILGWSTLSGGIPLFTSWHPSYYARQKTEYTRASGPDKEEKLANLKALSNQITEHWQEIAEAFTSAPGSARELSLNKNQITLFNSQKPDLDIIPDIHKKILEVFPDAYLQEYIEH